MPSAAASRLIAGFDSRDPLLHAFLDDAGLIRVERGPGTTKAAACGSTATPVKRVSNPLSCAR